MTGPARLHNMGLCGDIVKYGHGLIPLVQHITAVVVAKMVERV